MSPRLPEPYAHEVIARCIADAQRAALAAQFPRSFSDLGAAARAGRARLAEALRSLHVGLDRVSTHLVAATDPADTVWPVLRDYPYGPSPR